MNEDLATPKSSCSKASSSKSKSSNKSKGSSKSASKNKSKADASSSLSKNKDSRRRPSMRDQIADFVKEKSPSLRRKPKPEPTEQDRMVQDLRMRFESLTHEEDKVLYAEYKNYLSDRMLRRFLVAMKNKPDDAFRKLKDHIEWRKQFGTDYILAEDFSAFENRRELYWGGTDHEGFPSLIFRFSRHDVSESTQSYVRYLVYVLEKGRKVLRFDKMNVIFDVGGASRSQFSVDVVKSLVSVLQHNYPERLRVLYIFPVSTLERMVCNLVKSFMDPVTAKKMVLLSPSEYRTHLATLFDAAQLEVIDGGSVDAFQPLILSEEDMRKRERTKIRHEVKTFFREFKTKEGRDPSSSEVTAMCKLLYIKARRLDRRPSSK